MHIKRIVIQGFKTYKNTTIIDSFSPQHNVVVGRNGSGKSNFFAAIRFVLSDAYTNMSREERQSLIHEGSGTVMSAYVEIVFDNTDKRFPIEKDEIVIRRTIGMKKDDYSLDSKSATKSDIMNLLEAAGFSKSNPYYIVPQGRITSLTNAKDSERLALLKEVAGAKVFETKLKESLKEMTNTNKKREQIDEMLRYIQSRLDDLDMEKNDLKEYETLNNKKKVLEFNLFDRELTSLTEQIDAIENDYSNAVQDTNGLVEKLDDREKMARKIESQLTELNSSKKLSEIDASENDTEIQELLSKIGQAQAVLKETEVEGGASKTEISESITLLEEQVKLKEQVLDQIEPALKKAIKLESATKAKLNEMKLTQRSIFSKRGRFQQFSNQTDRDNWLNFEIKSIGQSLEAKKADLAKLQHLKSENESETQNLLSQLSKLEEDSSVTGNMNEVNAKMSDVKLSYNTAIDERKQLWREESKLNSIIQSYENEKSIAQQNVSETMDRSMALGLESAQKIAARLGLTGVYGTLGELIDVSEKYKTAIEVVGGNSLFHIVVDTDRTASLIMDELIREQSGRVTFMPLNRINPADITYPEGNDSVPLIKKIAFEDYLAPVVKQVFGKTVVCVSLERGAQIARTSKLNAITLDGDRCDKKGVLTGGFRDQNKSRVDALKALTKWKSEIHKTNEKLTALKLEIDAKDDEITKINQSLNDLRKELDVKFNERESLLSLKSQLLNSKSRYAQELASLESRIQSNTASIGLLQKQLDEYHNELLLDFGDSALSAEEQSQVDELTADIPQYESKYNAIVEELNELELKSSSLSSDLNEILYPRLRQLKVKLSTASEEDSDSFTIQEAKRQLKVFTNLKSKFEEANEELRAKIEDTNSQIKSKQDQLKKLNESQRSILRRLENYGKNAEKSLGKKIVLGNRRDEINKKVRELGVLPEEAFTTNKHVASTQVLKMLNEVAESLKKYSHINKKALEQFLNFTKQRDSLIERRVELDHAKESIEDLITVLERRKDDAIVRTFKEVSIGFTEVFEKLVPAGTGKLIIQKRDIRQQQAQIQAQTSDEVGDENDEDDERDKDLIDLYVGIAISVSFNSKKNEQQRIEQLSGGQKSLCAIALILAIQRCDPAPFYLFDEIDANLDAQYRSSVSRLINELSQNAQFICTTFRPEMLEVCDKYFGVMFNNKVSTVSEIDQNDALGFIEGQQRR